MINRLVIITFVTGILLINTCTTSVTGNSSETSNGIIVVARANYIECKVPPYSSLCLFRADYKLLDEISYDSAQTDSSGKFSFTVTGGSYNLFCYGKNGLRSLTRVSVNDTVVSGDTLKDILSMPGSIEGYVPFTGIHSYLYLEGSTFFTYVNSNGYFRIDSIPEGVYNVKQLSTGKVNFSTGLSDTLSYEITSSVKVVSDSLVTIKWR
jgi:hypothetical protein